jgi:hypothetical protein
VRNTAEFDSMSEIIEQKTFGNIAPPVFGQSGFEINKN